MAPLFDALFKAFADAIAFFYKLIPSYGIAIVLLTIAVRLVLFPLTAKQARSMQKMQQVQPELKRLQAKYKNDRQKLNEEMMKFYKENNINPLAGCLPLLLQLPLFIVLYRVIRGLTNTVIVSALVVPGAGTGAVDHATLANVKVTGQTARMVDGKLTDAKVSATVEVDGKPVGKLSTARIVNGQITGAATGDKVE